MSELNLQLPTEIVERAVRDKINAAIAAQLGNPEEMIQKLVEAALSQQVDSTGKRSRSSYDNKFEFLDVIMGNFVRDAAKEALNEYLEENRVKIKESVKKEIAKSPSKFAKVFMDGLTDSMKSSYSSRVEITFNTKN